MGKNINVNIKCSQVVFYNQNVKMSIEDYNRLKELDGSDVSEGTQQHFFQIIRGYIDPDDVYDAGDEFGDFEIDEASD